ncbi:V-type ATP synthase subunit I [Clostridium sediminicola]|uniref:V-type ATP synthase subunit I n=1 Tax=Clostridium sediminicola TaxID=3114879 RepID=UPI0031F229DC
MAIVKMNKFNLYAFESQKETLLQNLQKFEGVQFRNLHEKLSKEEFPFLKTAAENDEIHKIESQLSKVKFSIDFLEKFIPKESGLKSLKEGKRTFTFDQVENFMESSNWELTYENLKKIDEKLNFLHNKETKLQSEIEAVKPWVEFDAPFNDLKDLSLTIGFIGTIPQNSIEFFQKEFSEQINNSYIEIISEDKNDLYLIIVVPKEDEELANEIVKKYGFSKANYAYDKTPLEVIKSHKKEIELIIKEIEDISNKVSMKKKELDELLIVYEHIDNMLSRAKACENFVKSENIILVEGWSSTESNDELINIIEGTLEDKYYLEFSEASEADNVPIELKNNGFVEPFESITEMYSLPHYNEVDPTPILSIFYFVFFGMMLSDAGYGLIMVAGTAIALAVLPLEKAQKNFAKLLLYLGISTTIWGIIYGGWFGDAPTVLFGITVPKLIDAGKEINFVLILSVVFGLVHLFVGLGIKAYVLLRNNKPIDALFDVGLWVVTLVGAILMALVPATPIGKILLIAGLIGLFLTQGRDAESIGGKIGGGVYGVYGITGYFGDVVSYSRLMALGLATGFIASALNMIVKLIPAPAVYIIGPILFVALHLFNLAINALGSYVHTARLQYLEFFNKFYEGGGKKFKPFKSSNKYINMKNN